MKLIATPDVVFVVASVITSVVVVIVSNKIDKLATQAPTQKCNIFLPEKMIAMKLMDISVASTANTNNKNNKTATTK